MADIESRPDRIPPFTAPGFERAPGPKREDPAVHFDAESIGNWVLEAMRRLEDRPIPVSRALWRNMGAEPYFVTVSIGEMWRDPDFEVKGALDYDWRQHSEELARENRALQAQIAKLIDALPRGR